jgi:hypothetical protein
MQATLLASLFEFGGELRAAIDLHRAKPFLLRKKTKWAGVVAGDNDCALPSSSNRTDHSAVANDKTSAG